MSIAQRLNELSRIGNRWIATNRKELGTWLLNRVTCLSHGYNNKLNIEKQLSELEDRVIYFL